MGRPICFLSAGSRVLLSRVLACVLSLLPAAFGEAHAANYYVDCTAGNDRNDGLSETSAWQSTGKVAEFAFQFQDGDHIRFKRGCTWEQVLLPVAFSLTFEAYGEGAERPRLIAATRYNTWSSPSNGIIEVTASIAPNDFRLQEIFIVRDEKHGLFYKKVTSRDALDALDAEGKFFHDVSADRLYVRPLPNVEPAQDLYVSNQPRIIELRPGLDERVVVVVDGLHLAYANEYAIGFWYQSSNARYGSLRVANCLFTGNAYQAIHIGGTNTFKDVEILSNTITANGNEGIYIGFIKGEEEGEVVTRSLRISGNTIGGGEFGWRAAGGDSAANGEGIDIKQGVAAGTIDHNTIFDLNGMSAINIGSSKIIVEHNTIRDVRLLGATEETSIAGITVDARDNKGTTVVRNNIVTMAEAHGIVIRGEPTRAPRVEVYGNKISVTDPYSPFAFTSQNVKNTVIRNNQARGGKAGLAVLQRDSEANNVEFSDNVILNVSTLVSVETGQDLSSALRFYNNTVCVNGSLTPDQQDNYSEDNRIEQGCSSERLRPLHPQGLKFR